MIRPRVIDCEECGSKHYWCDACQRALCVHVENADAPVSPADSSSLERLQPFVTWVLADISAEARLVELTKTPEAKYVLRIEIPGEVPKSLVIPECLIESAVIQPLSARTLRNLLHAHILGMAQTRAISDTRETRAARQHSSHPEESG